SVHDAVCGAERVELHRAVAPPDDVAGTVGERVRRPLRAVPAVRVYGDTVADAPAEQVVDRPSARLADAVPAGHLDRRAGGHVHLAAVRVDVADHALVEEVHLGRLEPDIRVPELVNRRL